MIPRMKHLECDRPQTRKPYVDYLVCNVMYPFHLDFTLEFLQRKKLLCDAEERPHHERIFGKDSTMMYNDDIGFSAHLRMIVSFVSCRNYILTHRPMALL